MPPPKPNLLNLLLILNDSYFLIESNDEKISDKQNNKFSDKIKFYARYQQGCEKGIAHPWISMPINIGDMKN